jgi:tetratricopeptide (TPR) repeat protein
MNPALLNPALIDKPADIIEISLKPGVQPQIDAALAMRSAGRLEEALRALANPSEFSARLYTIRGEIEFALGRFEDAALSYFAVVHTEPGNAGAHYNLALCLQRSDRWDASCQAFERALSLDPGRDTARLGLGASLLYLNRLDEALTTFERCAEAFTAPASFGKAVALQLMHRCGEAEAAYENLLASDPDSAHSNCEETLSNLIALAVETQDFDRVRDYSQRLLKIAPQATAGWQGLAAAALDRQDHHAAARYCDRILELAPDCLEAWHNLGVALDRILISFSVPHPVAAVPAARPAQWEVG